MCNFAALEYTNQYVLMTCLFAVNKGFIPLEKDKALLGCLQEKFKLILQKFACRIGVTVTALID